VLKYQCQLCDRSTFKNWRDFVTHLRRHKIRKKEYFERFPYIYPEPVGVYGVDYVTCPICNDNREFQSLTQHLINKHKILTEEFLVKFPGKKLFTEKYSKMRADFCRKGLTKNWADPEYRKKRSEYCSEFFSKINSGSKRPVQSETMKKTLKRLWKDEEYCKKQSERMKERHKSGELERQVLNGFGKKWIKHETWYGKIATLKSSYEVYVAKFLDENKIMYEYEKMYEYHDSYSDRDRKYYADFYLPDYNIVLEVKASWAIDRYQVLRDKMLAVLETGTRYKYVTERDLGKLVSLKEFEMLIQSNNNE
jgi:hypothetical protein